MTNQPQVGDVIATLIVSFIAIGLGYVLVNWGQQTFKTALQQLPEYRPPQLNYRM